MQSDPSFQQLKTLQLGLEINFVVVTAVLVRIQITMLHLGNKQQLPDLKIKAKITRLK